MRNYFTLDGVDSRDFGVYISGQGTFSAPGRDYNIISVPGRNGDLVGPERRFTNGSLTYEAFIYKDFKQNISGFRNFLLSLFGYHDLIDSYHPDEIRKVFFEGSFDPTVTTKNDVGSFDVTFNCKPQRYLASGNEVTTFDSAGETETLSGSIVTFDNPDVATVNALSTAINPIQDLHGYDSPWPAGGGKNLFNKDAPGKQAGYALDYNTGNAYQTSSGNYSTSDFIPVVAGQNYIASGNSKATDYCWYDSGKVFIRGGGNIDIAKTAPSNAAYARIDYWKADENSIQFEQNSSATSYAPYSNLCPISGWDAVGIGNSASNLIDASAVANGFLQPIDGVVYDNQNWNVTPFIPARGGDYTLSWESAVSTYQGTICAYDQDQHYITGVNWSGGAHSHTFTLPFGTSYLRASWSVVVSGNPAVRNNIRLNFGGADLGYTPFVSGNTYTITLGQTVYGGTLDVTGGTMTVDRAKVNVTSLRRNTATAFYFIPPQQLKPNQLNALSDKAKTANNPSAVGVFINYSGAVRLNTAEEYATAADCLAAFGGSFEIVAELATPITIQLDPVTISTISGQTNNVWANTGDITATIAFPQHQFTITNPTLFDSQPLLRVYGTGILGIGSQQITITQADVYTDIDCEMMDCFKGTSNKNPYVQFTDHNFPVLKSGTNNFSLGTGITKVEITPRWWRV